MSAITTLQLSREEFVEWVSSASFSSPAPPSVRHGKSNANAHDVHLVWSKSGSDVHPIVMIPKSELADFFAFVSTYFKSFSPYTAFIRVLPLELQQVFKNQVADASNQLALAKAIAGGSIVEAWMHSYKLGERSANPLPLLRNSLSSALGSAILAGYGGEALDWVADEWEALQSNKASKNFTEKRKSILSIWSLVGAATLGSIPKKSTKVDKLIIEILSSAMRNGSLDNAAIRVAEKLSKPAIDLVGLLAASREDRIHGFNELVADLKRRNDRSPKAQFLAGLHLAIAGNGSLELMRSAREFDGWLDGAITWFGICCAFFEGSNVLSYANSTGRRHVRDLLSKKDVFGAVTADISSSEFKFTIEQTEIASDRLGVGNTGSIEVEILPGVSTHVELPTSRVVDRSREDLDKLLHAVDQAAHATERTRRMMFDFVDSERQGEMFGRPSRHKRR